MRHNFPCTGFANAVISVVISPKSFDVWEFDSTDDLLLLQISIGVVWQASDLNLSRNTLYLLSPRLCFFILSKRDLFVYSNDSMMG